MPPTDPPLAALCSLAFDALPQGVLITDFHEEGNPIIYANPAFERLTGYGADEVLGRNCRFLQGPRTDPAELMAIRDAVAERRVYQGLLLNYRKDGSEFWNELTIGPVADGDQPDRYLVGIQLDVTRRLQLEEQLRESQKMEALGKLTGGIAHDFNNLLALIMGNAEVIAGHCPPESVAGQATADIIEAALAGSSLVKRMLEFSVGHHRRPEPVAINRVIEDVIRLVARTVRASISVESDLDAAAGEAMIDETMFETALINLALNARDAMPDGGVMMFRTQRRADGLLSVTVSDTGSGMDEETARRAFEPYYSTKGPERGTGLGLAMVYSFAEQSGGRAVIDTKPGAGTIVELLLPAAPVVP
jgi:PAS domain S-box-containing protein